MKQVLLSMAVLALSACASTPDLAIPLAPEVSGWRAVTTAEDARRIDQLPATWASSLSTVSPRYRKMVTKAGDLLVPDAARNHPTPPPGSYRCRLVKLGIAASAGKMAGRDSTVRAFPDYFCYIRGEEDNILSFSKQTGTELPGGWLHPDGNRRLILTGARQHGPGDTSLAYGTEPERDVIGVLERIGPFRWRIVLPWRDAGTGLDIYELTPVPPDQQAEEPRVTQVMSPKDLRTP